MKACDKVREGVKQLIGVCYKSKKENYMLRLKTYMLLATALFFCNIGLASSSLAPPIKEDQLKQSNVGAYLGLGLDILPRELQAQLPEDVLIGQGVLISGFSSDSPAPQQQVKLYDILLNYNGVAIMHPRQLIQVIKGSKPNQKVKLTIVRKGKIIELPIVVGSQNYPLDEDQLDYQFNMQVMGFDGFKMKMPSKNYFEATIRFLAPDGVVRRRTFKGYYNQVLSEIQMAPDLTKYAKQKLINVITTRKDDEDGWFGDMMPFSDGIFNF